jgi:hypothetical protein
LPSAIMLVSVGQERIKANRVAREVALPSPHTT